MAEVHQLKLLIIVSDRKAPFLVAVSRLCCGWRIRLSRETAVSKQRLSMIRRDCLTQLKALKETCLTVRQTRETVPQMSKEIG